jgi:hypothetical protein
MSKSAIWESYHRLEEREKAIASTQTISKPSGAPDSLLLPEEETIMPRIGA